LNKITRRKFFESGVKLAGLAGIGGPWLRELADFRGPEKPSSGPLLRPNPHPNPQVGLGRFFGTQTHFGQHRPDADKILDLIKNAGIGWIRDEVYWSEVEKEKGVFRFPPDYDHYLSAAQARGIQVLLILDFGNAVYSGPEKGGPATDVECQAFARYCGQVVRRYKPLGVRYYEVWNEPNASMFWKPRPNPEDYAKLLEAAFKSCKDADPDATVLGCSTSGTDLAFIGRVFDAGGGRFMDAVSFHPYCAPLPPEKKLPQDFSKLKSLAPGKPLWITEFGYPTHTAEAGVDEETQANYLVRAFLLARASPSIERVSWYDFQNDGEDPAEAEFNFGIVRKNLSPKPSYGAFKTMASLVRDLPVAEFQVVGNTYLARFGAGEDRLSAVWRLGGTESVEIPCANGRYRITERDGESRAVEAKDSRLEIAVSEKPKYIVPAT
jgi:hypothetical protein